MVSLKICRKCEYGSGGYCEYSKITGKTKAYVRQVTGAQGNARECMFFREKQKRVRNNIFRVTNKADNTLIFEGNAKDCAIATGHTAAYIRNLANGVMTSKKLAVETVHSNTDAWPLWHPDDDHTCTPDEKQVLMEGI